jgi:hypothetical protein
LVKSFKNSVGRYYLQALFYETTLSYKSTVVYTLKETDHEGYPSLYRLYMEAGDPTEYQFAVTHLDGWTHWQALVAAKWFLPYVEAWRAELAVKFESDALARIRAVSADPSNPNYYYANKHLLELARKPADARKRGRPTKGSSPADETHERAVLREIAEDAKRLGVVN